MIHRARSTIATVGLAAGLLLTGLSPAADADTCTGPVVTVYVKKGTPLSGTMHPTVEATCDDSTYDATVQIYLKVGTHRIARLSGLQLQNIGQTPSRSTLSISKQQLAAARRYGKKSGHHYADLKFVVRPSVDGSGQTSSTYAIDSFPKI
jgi:hypothetical protein